MKTEKRVIAHDDLDMKANYEWLPQLFPNAVVVEDETGTWRFRWSNIVCWIVDAKKADINELWILACHGAFTRRDMMKFYMDMGYSLGGFVEIFGDDLDEMEEKNVTFDALTDEKVCR